MTTPDATAVETERLEDSSVGYRNSVVTIPKELAIAADQSIKIRDALGTKEPADHVAMKRKLLENLADPETRAKTEADFIYTFMQVGLAEDKAKALCSQIISLMQEDRPLAQTEQAALKIFEGIVVNTSAGPVPMIDALHYQLKGRAELIYSQVKDHLAQTEGKVIDYGAGDGQITQLLHDRLGLDIEGADIRSYASSHVTVPMLHFDGDRMDSEAGHYQAALLTNVLHHEANNETILNELDRIVQPGGKIVVIETVPVGSTEAEKDHDKGRTFMNDYLYNRAFHNANVPVPGSFETPEDWIKRFESRGWKIEHAEDLGFDQPTIKDRHFLVVIRK